MVSDGKAPHGKVSNQGVSIRFEVRGGFRLKDRGMYSGPGAVSIRFEVRGGFRRVCDSLADSRDSFNPL